MNKYRHLQESCNTKSKDPPSSAHTQVGPLPVVVKYRSKGHDHSLSVGATPTGAMRTVIKGAPLSSSMLQLLVAGAQLLGHQQ